MSPEEKELLEKSVSLAEDNNKILHSIKRSIWMGRIMTFIYWMIIIGSAIGAYYYLEPYYNKALDMYNKVSNTQQKINDAAGTVQSVLKIPDSLLKSLQAK